LVGLYELWHLGKYPANDVEDTKRERYNVCGGVSACIEVFGNKLVERGSIHGEWITDTLHVVSELSRIERKRIIKVCRVERFFE
jgi:hypothetical protein